ncbi:MAG TPA: diadenylate cyclase CdaA [Ignavibacteriales bacterium]|nr:diadenylate cyclase CdaA [Ignavibacteriales bacterium]HOL82071.1 diadenylate cyclase CdaA [Ignavibacteriales bacterium]HOM66136.1 diadenylate cyclase CdaA [Ignavibacteriales bacterium]HPD66470.1 diadenylate cyclase CdaA [Ignavibacteriales bacterium]HPP34193.1 diadenylate cyclase CdaA [Ignavibacteriales bacterium]
MINLFKIGFYTFTLLDLVDISIVAFLIYSVYKVVRGTIAVQMFIGLVFILLSSFVFQSLNLRTIAWLLKLITDSWIVAFIIIFHPEIRKILLQIGKNPFRIKISENTIKKTSDVIVDACFDMSEKQHGALIVLDKNGEIPQNILDSGDELNADISVNMLKSIFYPKSPLHDGAIIIQKDIIRAARCTLPLSEQKSYKNQPLGTRHRAAIGISEIFSVLCVVVSEESGSIGIAYKGELIKGLSKNKLAEYITKYYQENE